MKPVGFILIAVGVVAVVEALRGLQDIGAKPIPASAAPASRVTGPTSSGVTPATSVPGVTTNGSVPSSTRPLSFSECVQTAANIGFTPANAQTVCTIAQTESGIGGDTRCTCAYTANGQFYHDEECTARGLTGHCGVFQWSQSDSRFASALQNNCYKDPVCSLRWMFGFSGNSGCFADWGPDVGRNYGYCSYGR